MSNTDLAKAIDAALQAGAALAQTVLDSAEELRESDPFDPDTVAGADALKQEVDAWEQAARDLDTMTLRQHIIDPR